MKLKKTTLAIALFAFANVANANNTINEHSRFVDVKLGYTLIAADSTINSIDSNYSFAAERTHIFSTLSKIIWNDWDSFNRSRGIL